MSESDYHIRQDCRLCGGSYTEVLDLGHTALANEVWDDPNVPQDTFPLKLVQCDACGHMQNPVVVKPERLFRHYSYTSGLTETYRKHLEEYAEQVRIEAGVAISSFPLIVEIGGNDGTMGAFLQPATYLNVDPSDTGQVWGRRIREFFTPELARRIREEHGPAKAIVANHVFAHADDLHSMAEGVRELLADDGIFYCEVGHGPTQLNSGCLDVVYHEHLSFHDEDSFRGFWKGHGFKKKSLEFNDAQGGSMRCALVKGDPGHLNRWKRFDIPRIKQAAEHLAEFGAVLKSMGGGYEDHVGVAAYGAPAKLTTLRALLGLHLEAVFDDSPRKQGRFIPGCERWEKHLKIRKPNLDALNHQGFILIASWNFEREIRERWKDYRGTWIVPLPEVRFYRGGGA